MKRPANSKPTELHLRVYRAKSELIYPDGTTEVFLEGPMDKAARARMKEIAQALADGWLEKQILSCRGAVAARSFIQLTDHQAVLLNTLVESVTSEVGRALLALTVLQLCIKAIAPQQNIRLHKGGTAATSFSWRNGISMRSLDKKHITPVLRRFDLLKLNADGFMMTRSLAENYPYSLVYKAAIRGARFEWMQIVEEIETGQLPPEPALRYLLTQLLNRAEAFHSLAAQTINLLNQFFTRNPGLSRNTVMNLLLRHIAESDYAARLMEISMHSLVQAMADASVFGDAELKPLSQMRSANKKHGNVGDIELLEQGQIVEAWDAKYGKSYLRDELEELADKLALHPGLRTAGFVTSVEPERLNELYPRLEAIKELHGTKPEITTFGQWVASQFARSNELLTETELAQEWLRAYTESIAQKRTVIAPIDEPCYQWLEGLKSLLANQEAADTGEREF